jgi:hypothetical protein
MGTVRTLPQGKGPPILTVGPRHGPDNTNSDEGRMSCWQIPCWVSDSFTIIGSRKLTDIFRILSKVAQLYQFSRHLYHAQMCVSVPLFTNSPIEPRLFPIASAHKWHEFPTAFLLLQQSPSTRLLRKQKSRKNLPQVKTN